ncbi:methyltransferase domain-containing protein [Synechococcus sp. CS-602]|uniref:class I SAM-dependent methyltransferase n=1 Tax=Synechococcaceae TaxID=1890426 RepID=UPI0008FF4055|nr:MULTISPECIES: methyltransferase domain-containing protein [Synechococcaceae]MCT4364738.1 methyltransferase domain-containing protein [Candidatus Regnicoccus frigidus MAG-AL1]APD47722.1 SAM-dependent methyltransferase [Synechococcus sp. SynAce01]MCT0201476.1 methyltransferase domain-containing protein [Synechococcus sp. CS-603]MCT0204790.1 methyltransferase domain-containing protein [Synechococcus sp. CS-602]MCT0247349.1 methyltransferase domain-containing protein [Synechococcus sp. CS-601]
MAASQPDSQATGTYVLGTDAAEQQRLSQQHALWLSSAQEAWGRAGLAAGERVLDLGAGPGFVSLELARQVGAGGRVLALELSPSYGEAARRAAAEAGLAQLEVRRHDLCSDPLPQEGFDLVWCRWVAMFLPSLEPLLDQLAATLKPGARVLFHEYVHWSTFGLHPDGDAVRRFGAAALASFRAAGGDPDVNRRLPSLLAARGFRIDALRPLPLLGSPGDAGDAVANWLESFVDVYGQQLIRQGFWTPTAAAAASAEIAAASQDPGAYWMGPTVMELQATR